MGRGGFSWKRALGISTAKSRVSRATGIPLTKSGRQRKIGKALTGGCCLFSLFYLLTPIFILIALVLIIVL